MVYRGKPSKSCRQCRKRDIKCDKGKDSCGQCIRAHLVCPGYHDQSKVIFQHETKAVISRINRRCLPSHLGSPSRPLLPDVEDRAKDLWVSRYVTGKSAKFPDLQTYWRARPHPKPLTVCVRAVSLVYLSFEIQSPDILQRARHRYGSTLLLVNQALRSPGTATNNATLFTVLLLQFYEVLIQHFFQEKNPPTHIDGAIAILKVGKPSQFNDVVRLRLFHHLCLGSILDCMRRGVHVSQDLISLHKTVDPRSPQWQLENSCIEFMSSQEYLATSESALLQTTEFMDLLIQALATTGRIQVATDSTSEPHLRDCIHSISKFTA